MKENKQQCPCMIIKCNHKSAYLYVNKISSVYPDLLELLYICVYSKLTDNNNNFLCMFIYILRLPGAFFPVLYTYTYGYLLKI